jgi:DUF1680 family protein
MQTAMTDIFFLGAWRPARPPAPPGATALSAATPPPPRAGPPTGRRGAGYPLQSLARVAGLIGIAASAIAQSINPVPFSQTKITDRFWAPRLAAHATATLPICIEQSEVKTGRIRNFEKAAAGLGRHEGIYYDDSDVYKVLEGMAYSLINNPNPQLEEKCDEWIDKITAAQQDDGYLNTFFTLTDPRKRWTDMEKHEDYCAGHLIEAAIAYFQATGKRALLDAAIRLANHLDRQFGPGKKNWVPGHQEIELALVRLYGATQNEKYLALAYWFLEQRGRGHGRGTIWSNPAFGPVYCQDHVPARDFNQPAGHAVRAMYQLTAMADVQAFMPAAGYDRALNSVWQNIVERNMYITGGIGSSRKNEGFTEDFDLPNAAAYAETCAAIGMIFWNHRMFLRSGQSRYIDVLERALYNGALAGVSIAGDRFFYVNPLESAGNHLRKEWYGTACCPSNISRLLPSLGHYVYAWREDEVWVNLFIESEAEVHAGNAAFTIVQKTDYPWNGRVQLQLVAAQPLHRVVHIRIPGWNKKAELYINNQPAAVAQNENGYVTVARTWKPTDRLELALAMPAEVVASDPRVKSNAGKRAVQRGPLVYCLEEADNPGINFSTVQLSGKSQWTIKENSGVLNNVTLLQTGPLTFIPYYAWANRQPGKMKVWIEWRD